MDSLSTARRRRVNKNTDHAPKKEFFLPLEGLRKLTSDRLRMNKFIEFMFQILSKSHPYQFGFIWATKNEAKIVAF